MHVLHALRWPRSEADDAVFRLKIHAQAGGHVLCDLRRQSYAEIDQRIVVQLLSDPASDQLLGIHGRTRSMISMAARSDDRSGSREYELHPAGALRAGRFR